MNRLSKDEDNWEYLFSVLSGTNNNYDLADKKQNEPKATPPQPEIEAQIQNSISPVAPLTTISGMRYGKIHIHGQFSQATGRHLRQGLHITEAVITDATGSARVVWFNQPYKATSLRRGIDYELQGNFALYRQSFQINNAKVRPLSEGCGPFENRAKKK